MSKDCLLIVFVKNALKGKVKTRLAKTIGSEEALRIYDKLLSITEKGASKTKCKKEVWYSDYVDHDDHFDNFLFEKRVQVGEDLGQRMKRSIAKGFDEGFGKVVIIGSDCPDISTAIIEEAFEQLNSNDVVIGPSEDGGYYLLGMNKFTPQLFQGIKWSTPNVLNQTIETLDNLNYNYLYLPALNDVDTAEDLEKSSLMNA